MRVLYLKFLCRNDPYLQLEKEFVSELEAVTQESRIHVWPYKLALGESVFGKVRTLLFMQGPDLPSRTVGATSIVLETM